MLPKRPTSCLAIMLVPVVLILLLLILGGLALKLLASRNTLPAQVASSTQSNGESRAAPSLVSRLPSTIPATTTLLVATASSNAVKEQVYSVDAAGTATLLETPEGFRPELWQAQGISLTPPLESVTGSAWRVTGKNWNVPLRTRGGSVWQDPVILGQFSSGRLAIVAYRNQRALLSVSRAGDIQVVQVLEDELSPLTVQGAYAWFVRAHLPDDPALERLPQGPSELVRLSEQGTSSTIAQDPALILTLVPGPDLSSVAYQSSDDSLVLVSGEKLNSSIKGWRPQVWVDSRTLLVSRGTVLGWVDAQDPKQVVFYTDLHKFIRGVSLSVNSSSAVVK